MILFLKPGDTFISKEENLHFHRGAKYEISKIFHVTRDLRIFIKDKNGFDIPYNPYYFEPSSTTLKASNERHFRTRLLFFYEKAEIFQHCKRHLYDFENNVFFSISKGIFSTDDKAKEQIRKYRLDISSEGNYKYFYDESANSYIYEFEDLVNYFKKYFKSETEKYSGWEYNFHLPHISFKTQENIDYQYYISTEVFQIFSFDEKENEKLVNFPKDINFDGPDKFCDNGFKYFLDYCARRTFDKNELTEQIEKDLINDILTLFKELPSSHSGTSIAKILRGKSKIKNQKVEHLFGKYETFIKHEQLFELANAIETYLFNCKVFKTKEEYSSSEEWRGAFEFIGSKYVDKNQLDICINFLK